MLKNPAVLRLGSVKRAQLDYKLHVVLDHSGAAAGGDEGVPLAAPPLMLSVTSGPPCKLVGSMGAVEAVVCASFGGCDSKPTTQLVCLELPQ